MSKQCRRSVRTLSVALLCALALGCSGGGGSGGGGGDKNGYVVDPAYKGVQSQAVIDQTNAEALVLDAYSSGSFLDFIAPLPAESGVQGSQVLSGRIPGTCLDPGDLAYNIDVLSNGAFSGTMNLNGFCSEGVTFNGALQLSGSKNPGTGNLDPSLITVSSLKVAAEGEALFTVNGSISTQYAAGGKIVKRLKLVFEGSPADATYMDYTVTEVPKDGHDEIDLQGRYYDGSLGYIAISTQKPVKNFWASHLPEAGMLRFAGANGTYATIEFEPEGGYALGSNGTALFRGTLN